MRVLVTGARGLVGSALLERFGRAHDVVPTVHRDPAPAEGHVMAVDESAAVRRIVDDVDPDWIVHAAGLTDVDHCERFPASAQWVNGLGTENVARAAEEADARLAYVSADYVFPGRRGSYAETDDPDPVNAYGKSKLHGEHRARRRLGDDDVLVCRSSMVFGPHQANFVTCVRDRLADGDKIRVAEDQVLTPTHVHDLARQLLALIEAGESGIWHTAGAEPMSRLDVAYTVAQELGLNDELIQAVQMEDLAWVAPRPRDVSLVTEKVAEYVEPWGVGEGVRAMREEAAPRPAKQTVGEVAT